MKTHPSLILLAAACALAPVSRATVIGFGQLGGSNTMIPTNLGSNATAAGAGYVVTNGTTPGIGLTWDADWDIHTSSFFAPLESQTPGVGDWDNEGAIPRVAQLDLGAHSIVFTTAADAALRLNSFDFGHTGETIGTTVWNVSLTNSANFAVWQEQVTFINGATVTLAPNFTGELGEDYTLSFSRLTETYNSNGRHGIDNLSFNQVPEPGAFALIGLAGLAVIRRRR